MLLKLNYQYKYLRLFLSSIKKKKQQKNKITDECNNFNSMIIIIIIIYFYLFCTIFSIHINYLIILHRCFIKCFRLDFVHQNPSQI